MTKRRGEFSEESERKLRAIMLEYGYEPEGEKRLTPKDLDTASKLLLDLFNWAIREGYYCPPSKRN